MFSLRSNFKFLNNFINIIEEDSQTNQPSAMSQIPTGIGRLGISGTQHIIVVEVATAELNLRSGTSNFTGITELSRVN